jgi:DNA ligase (NAD+)
MEGMGIRSYTKMIEAIEKSKDVKFENFVYSLGINQIGKGGAKRLAKYFNNDIEAFLEATKSHYTFMNIEDFGSITAYAVYDYFDNEDNMNQVRELLSIVRIKQEEKKDVDFKSLEGLAFVVTGSVETFKNRKELEDLITSLNGKLNGSVSAKTNFLINNDTTSTTGKNQKAKDLGVKIISENEFNIMIGRS